MTVRVVQAQFVSPSESRLDEDASKLFDFGMAHREGFTHADAELAYGWTVRYFYDVERRLRQVLSTEAENLVCTADEDNPNGPWLYRLTADVELTALWHDNRLADSETRLKTIVHVAQSAMHAHPARTTTGKRARILFKAATRALEDLEELRENSA